MPRPGINGGWRCVLCAGAAGVGLAASGLAGAGAAGAARSGSAGPAALAAVPSSSWFEGVAAASARSAWAVGIVGGEKTLIVRWNGTGWKRVPSPSPAGSSILDGVAATSARSAWAVGVDGFGQTLIEGWNGTGWTRVPSPRPAGGGWLFGVAATSARSAWAVGYAGNPDGSYTKTLIARWNGTAWTRVPSPETSVALTKRPAASTGARQQAIPARQLGARPDSRSPCISADTGREAVTSADHGASSSMCPAQCRIAESRAVHGTARGARRWRRMERSVSGGGAGRYLPVRSRCLHPGQQQGRRWPSSSSSWVRRMRRSRVISCLASSTQQMNSLRARGVMSFQASSAVGLAISALRRSAGSLCTTPPGTRWLLTGPR